MLEKRSLTITALLLICLISYVNPQTENNSSYMNQSAIQKNIVVNSENKLKVI
jgi:hypothetical protein